MLSATSASKFARCPSTLGVCEPLAAVQSRQPLQLLEVARRHVDHRHQLRANRANSQQFQLRLRHLGRRAQAFLVGRVTCQRARDGVGLRRGFQVELQGEGQAVAERVAAGLPRSCAINSLGQAETIGNIDVSRCLSHAIVSIFERDDGLYQIGLHDDAAGPFVSRKFAEAVAAQGEGHHALATS